MVDVSDASGRPDPVKDFEVIMQELESFGAGLEDKPMIVVAAKIDVANPKKLEKLKKFAERRGYPFLAISAVTGTGVQKLKYDVGAMVRQMREGKYEGPKARRTTTVTKVTRVRRVSRSRGGGSSSRSSAKKQIRGASKAGRSRKSSRS
jgi:GTPase involved in cell partitioning and DNA repair